MIKAIAFDLWETLISNDPEVSNEQKRLRILRTGEVLAANGYGALAERIEAAYHDHWNLLQERYWSNDRDLPCRDQLLHLLELLEVQIDDEPTLAAVEEAYANALLEALPAPTDGARETLEALKARGLRVGMISNTGRTPGYVLRTALRELGLAPFIDVMVFSNEHGYCKPQTSIFEELRQALAVQPHEVIFVGDNLYVDVHGAQRFGMKGVHFLPEKRGTAVAPAVDHGLEIVPDAVVTDLRDILRLVDR